MSAMAAGPVPGIPPAPAETLVQPRVRARNWAQIIIAGGVVLFFCSEAEMVLVVLLVSMLLAFILAPVVEVCERFKLPRAIGSGLAVLLLLALTFGLTYLSYNQAVTFVHNLPQYSGKIRDRIERLRASAEQFESGTDVLEPASADSKNVVRVNTAGWMDLVTRGFGSVYQVLIAASFIPFLVYFMLSWQQHVRSATVMLFDMKHRNAAYVTIGLIAKMMRSFMVGNLLVGLFISIASTVVFASLHLPFFYFVGPISGLFSLVPYLGVVLALLPPVVVGMGQMDSSQFVVLVVAVLTLHVFSLNVLYPKFLGNRLQLNPLAVTISLLFWGWFWGAMGLVLAIPLTGAMRIVFDHIEILKPYGAWLGE